MTVAFDDVLQFLEDLKAAAQSEEGEAVDDRLVRISISKRELSQTSTEVSLTAGFASLGELRQLSVFCGTDFARNGTEAGERSQLISDQIQKACKALGLTVRGGRFEE